MQGSRNAWGKMLEAERNRAGLTGDDLGRRVGCAQKTISDYERGELRPPLDKLSDLCEALDLHGEIRNRFVEEAYLAHAPERVRVMVVDLRARVRQLERHARLQCQDGKVQV